MSTRSIEAASLTRFWQMIHAVIQEIWTITETYIEEAAVRDNVPIELYYYAELGLETFSIKEFQHRDPFSNPEQFERLFPRLELKGWIIPMREAGRYEVTPATREAVRKIVQAGDSRLTKFESMPEADLKRLLLWLKQIVLANKAAPEPPEKWAIAKRFRVATRISPAIVQIRECLMDIFAYRDDAHLAAARPHFNQAGLVWNVLGAVATGSAVTAEKMAETMLFRGYDTYEYEAATKAAIAVGWLEATDEAGTFRPTTKGRELREEVEKLTNEYFYGPWVMLSPDDLDEFYNLLTKLREQLHAFKKNSTIKRQPA